MPSVEKAVQWAEAIAADDSHGYSQGSARMGSEFDCSSLVGRSLVAAGFDYPADWSPSTKQMKAHLERIGWKWHAGIDGVRRGDILWRSGHTAWAASSTMVCEAVPRNGKLTGDTPGDQNGQEIRVAKMGANWAGYWRYKDSDAQEDGKIDVDGRWGRATTKSGQKQAGTTVDGIVSGQNLRWKPYFAGCTTGWSWRTGSAVTGSPFIKKVQITLRDKYGQDVGEIDGIAGRKFWRAFECAAGYKADEKGLENPSNSIKWFQRKLNEGTFF